MTRIGTETGQAGRENQKYHGRRTIYNSGAIYKSASRQCLEAMDTKHEHEHTQANGIHLCPLGGLLDLEVNSMNTH